MLFTSRTSDESLRSVIAMLVGAVTVFSLYALYPVGYNLYSFRTSISEVHWLSNGKRRIIMNISLKRPTLADKYILLSDSLSNCPI